MTIFINYKNRELTIWLTSIHHRIERNQVSNYYKPVKQWVSPALQAVIKRCRQSHGAAPESGTNYHCPSIHIPTAVRRWSLLPDSQYSCDMSQGQPYTILFN